MKKLLTPQSRKRALSEDEKALWRAVARTTKPLRRRKPIVLDEGPDEAEVSRPANKRVERPVAPATRTAPAKPSAPPLAPLGRREKSKLAKGRHPIDARLDLHGMTQVRAHARLIAFLREAHGDGLTFVLVITGKGKSSLSEGERGVLRRQVPHWLALPELRSLVVGFEEAHIGHGGEGALYVRLRRAR